VKIRVELFHYLIFCVFKLVSIRFSRGRIGTQAVIKEDTEKA